MREQPEAVWLVVNQEETAYAAAFYASSCANPEDACKAWIVERLRLPQASLSRPFGAHAKRVEIWPNYLALSAAGARFINWGLLQLDVRGHHNLLTQMLGGEAAPIALASILFPEPT